MLTRQAALIIKTPATAELIEHLIGLQRGYCAKAEAQDLRGIHEANDAFHLALFSANGNPYLVRSLQDYMNLTLPMRAKNLADKQGLSLSRRQHDIMIELLPGRDNWALAQLCVEHTCSTANRTISAGSADRSQSLPPIDDLARVAVKLHAAERAALVEIANAIGRKLGLRGKRVIAKILGATGRTVSKVVGAVVVPPRTLVVGRAVKNLEVDAGMI